MANPNIQVTTTPGLSPTMQTYYDKRLLEIAKPNLVHQQFGQKRPIPKNSGKVIQFRKFANLPTITTPLQEGVIPDGQNLSMTEITAQVEQYGGYVAVSDKLDLTAIDPIIDEAIDLLGMQAAESIDEVTREALVVGTNVQYANGRLSRSAITSSDVLTVTEIKKAVRTLKRNLAQPFNVNGKGYYIAIVHPDAVYDLMSDPLWIDVSKYAAAEQIFNGEIGKLFGVKFVETTKAKKFIGAGANGIDVYATLVFGQNAYGVIDVTGSGGIKTIVHDASSGGTSNPLNQYSTIGWKVEAYAAKILNDLWIVRIEHAASA